MEIESGQQKVTLSRVYNSKPSRKKKAFFFLLSKSSVNERLSQFSP